MFDLVPWKPSPLPLSDHLQVAGFRLGFSKKEGAPAISFIWFDAINIPAQGTFLPPMCLPNAASTDTTESLLGSGERSMSRQRSLHCAQCAPLCHTTIQKGCLRVCCRWMAQKKRNPLRPTQVFSKEGK